jgi:PiT family inorganic phosphate transporter
LSQFVVFWLIAIFALSASFDYINGFHDTANAIATSVSTRALKPEQAIFLSATANFIGAVVFGTAVAGTIGGGIVADKVILPGSGSAGFTVLAAALIGAIAWNLITWALAIPSSSSHALVGGLIGAASATTGFNAVQWGNFAAKVVLPLLTSPVLGLLGGLAVMILLLNIFAKSNPRKVNERFRRLQVLSATYLALSHGSNDAQKTMGIMTLALYTANAIPDKTVPTWVILIAATAMFFGTAAGGWRIIKTMGQRVVRLDPVRGFAAETTGGSVILLASHFGMPVSTTHVITTAIMGVGTSDRISAVKWNTARSIITAWILTIPCSALIAFAAYEVLRIFGV